MNILDQNEAQRGQIILGAAGALFAAYQCGLLQVLVDGGGSLEALANRCNLNVRSLHAELGVLQNLGFASREENQWTAGFALTELREGPIQSLEQLFTFWSYLSTFLRTGKPMFSSDGEITDRGSIYSKTVQGLAVLFEANAADLAGRIEEVDSSRGVTAPECIIDVGAGSAVWSLEMCRRSEKTRVTVLDLPEVIGLARNRAEMLELNDRLDLMEGDMHSMDLPEGCFDRVVVANVLHLEQPEIAKKMVARLSRCLKPSGTFVIIDAMPADKGPNLSEAVYALHLSMRTDKGQVHSLSTLRCWLSAAGLEPGPHLEPTKGHLSIGALLGFVPA
jgi:SAM-dependent methyltransferase